MKMGSRILFEEDIVIKTEIPEETTIKEESEGDSSSESSQENYDFTEINDVNSIILGSKNSKNNSEILGNVILLGSRVPKKPIEYMGNEGNSQHIDNIGEDKSKGKRKVRTELEMLLDIDKKEDKNYLDDKYDVYGDDSKLFRKYKLRKSEQTISYKEPEDIKPKRRYSEDEVTDLTCPDCPQKFQSKVALFNHLRFHNKNVNGFTCSQCNQKFDLNTELVAHKQTHKENSFLCKDCKQAFSNHRDYLFHCFNHLDKPHFKCPECGQHYPKTVYKAHITMHFPKTISCHLCSFITNNEKNLRIHLNQHSDRFTCVECFKVCNSREMYNYHMSAHTGVKKFQCLYCGACFRSKSERRVHTRIHTGEKPYTCDICGYKTKQSTSLKCHKETHGEKKYTCDECGKKFLHKYSLVKHIMRSHMKKCLYKCPECDAQFFSAGGLKSHSLYKHTSERPFECKACDRKFISNNQYRKHCRAKFHLRNVNGLNIDE